MADLLIISTGDGGEAVLRANDLAMVQGAENMPFLAMFGGEDWWGNELFMQGQPTQQFKSRTQKALRENVLNSAGRQKIEQAMYADLEFMKEAYPGTTIKTETMITGTNRLEAYIHLNGQTLYMNWTPDEIYLTYKA